MDSDPRTLLPLERLAAWLDQNRTSFKGNIGLYRTLLENFYLTCNEPRLHDWLNFEKDISLYPTLDQDYLHKAFCTMYGTTPTMISMRDPRRTGIKNYGT